MLMKCALFSIKGLNEKKEAPSLKTFVKMPPGKTSSLGGIFSDQNMCSKLPPILKSCT